MPWRLSVRHLVHPQRCYGARHPDIFSLREHIVSGILPIQLKTALYLIFLVALEVYLPGPQTQESQKRKFVPRWTRIVVCFSKNKLYMPSNSVNKICQVEFFNSTGPIINMTSLPKISVSHTYCTS